MIPPQAYGILKRTATVLRVAGVTHNSAVNGPGLRNVLHLQGCTLGCVGCFNKHTWDDQGGTWHSVEDLVTSLTGGTPDGITISGGEPLQQIEALLILISFIKVKHAPYGIPIIMYTGYSYEEIMTAEILYYQLQALGLDAMICGRYEQDKAVTDRGLISSSNQMIFRLSDYYKFGELDSGPSQVEAIIEEDGKIRLSGFPSVQTVNQLRRETTDVSTDGL